jgi:hypothetical protein
MYQKFRQKVKKLGKDIIINQRLKLYDSKLQEQNKWKELKFRNMDCRRFKPEVLQRAINMQSK